MGYIKSLAYIGIGAEDPAGWATFASDVLGLQIDVPEGDDPATDGVVHFRMDTRSFRIAVENGENGALHYLGLDLGSVHDLLELTARLEDLGHRVEVGDDDLCARRRVATLRSCLDPFGNRLELFVGQEEAPTPFVSPTGARFVTGDLGLGHAFLFVSDIDAFVSFYVDVLGLGVSDTYRVGPGNNAYFLHCNGRHHSIAAMSAGGRNRLGHIMLEVDDIDAVGYAYDKVLRSSIPLFGTLGRHSNDRMISFYVETPSGVEIEYGVHGRLIDPDSWVAGHYTSVTLWGHKRQAVLNA